MTPIRKVGAVVTLSAVILCCQAVPIAAKAEGAAQTNSGKGKAGKNSAVQMAKAKCARIAAKADPAKRKQVFSDCFAKDTKTGH